MTGSASASPFLFRNKKRKLQSTSRSFNITSPVDDGLAIITIEANENFRLTSANDQFLKLISQDNKYPLGSLILNIFWGDDIEDDNLQTSLIKAYNDKSPQAFIWQVSVDKAPLTLLCKIIPLKNVQGGISQINIITSPYDNVEHLEIEMDNYNNFDPLTGLPNLVKFYNILEDQFKQASKSLDGYIKSQGVEASALFINVKKLQRINESYGYEFGDKALNAIAKLIKRSINEKAVLARFSNDHFVVFLNEIDFENVKHEANTTAQAIHHNLSTKPLIKNSDIRLSVSIGIATETTTFDNVDQLMQNAHLAMKKNNETSTNQTIVFNQDIKTQAATKLRLETELREALEANALELHYQPIVNLQTGLLSGVEALARWNNSSRGSVSPLEFINMAEEAGLIIPLGEWALTTACQQIKSWIDDDPLASSLFMAVNISSTHIMMGNIAALTRDALAKSGLDSANLKLELTESTIMENSDIARNILLDLKALGVSLAVDDFGTGYSSLSYLSRIPADTIKIDRSFVSKMERSEEGVNIIKVIINLAKSLGMSVVAEGIENEKQAMILKALGCNYGQGYLFSKAMHADKIPDLIREQPYRNILA